MAKPTEAWLRSEDHQKWADAMTICQSGAPWECAENGKCQFGGCFTTEGQAKASARRMISRLSSENEAVKAQLDRAVVFLGGRSRMETGG